MKNIMIKHYTLRPQMRIEDMVKLVYQSEFGCGHMADLPLASEHIEREISSIEGNEGEELFEYIGGGYERLNLRPAKKAGIATETIARLFYASASSCGSVRGFEEKLDELIAACKAGEIPFDTMELKRYLKNYKNSGYPPVSHSAGYGEAYSPAYRVILSEYARFIDFFIETDGLLNKKERVTIAIDGNCGAGKSSFAEIISSVYDCSVFHMDDFFLRPGQRTSERLREPGGNIDRERFAGEVIEGIKSGEEFYYRKYDCCSGALSEPVFAEHRRLNIIEGSYSMHPDLSGSYDFGIFIKISPEEQRKRLKTRDPMAYERFINEWIPLEEKYFSAFGIEGKCRFAYSADW